MRALGVETFRIDRVWSREQMRPSIYESAIVLASVRTEPGVVQDIERLVERDPDATISVRDSFNELVLVCWLPDRRRFLGTPVRLIPA